MPSDPSCIFCKIIAGQIPCYKVYEDDAVLAFLDIGPLVNGHTLVIPKDHVATVMQAQPDHLAAIMQRLPKISQAVLAATGAKACNILINNGSDAQQSVHHLHIHILPRQPGAAAGQFHIPWNPTKLDQPTAITLAQKIATNIK